MTWLLHEVGNEGLGRDLALYLGPMMNELFAGLAVPSVEQLSVVRTFGTTRGVN